MAVKCFEVSLFLSGLLNTEIRFQTRIIKLQDIILKKKEKKSSCWEEQDMIDILKCQWPDLNQQGTHSPLLVSTRDEDRHQKKRGWTPAFSAVPTS